MELCRAGARPRHRLRAEPGKGGAEGEAGQPPVQPAVLRPAGPPVRGDREAECRGPSGGRSRRPLLGMAGHGPPVRPGADPAPLDGAGTRSGVRRLGRAAGVPPRGDARDVREEGKRGWSQALRQLRRGAAGDRGSDQRGETALRDAPALPVPGGRDAGGH